MVLTLAGATLAAGALEAAGGIYGANKSASSAKQANKLSLLSQVMAQNHEKEKMKNAYQWTVADMEKAGINPILGATNNGAGAGSGAGPAISGQQSQEGQVFAQGIQSAVAAAQNQMNIANNTKLADTQSAVNVANATKTLKEAGLLNKYGEDKAIAEINNLNSSSAKATRDARENYSNLGRIAQDISRGVSNKIQQIKNSSNSAKKTKTFGDMMNKYEY